MFPLRALFRQRKDRSPSATPRSRISPDVSSRSLKNSDRTRPEVPANHSATVSHGRKRRISSVDDDSDASTAYSTKTKMRKHKVPKRASTPPSADPNTGSATAFSMPPDSESGRNTSMDRSKVARRGLLELAHSARKENHEDRSDLNGDMDVKELLKKLRLLQKEIDLARKDNEEQRKVADNLRIELRSSKKTYRRQTSQVDKLKGLNKKWEDQLLMVQENLQCQICLELLSRPHTLVPCGHVFCQGCLQNWFRSAPRQDEGDDEVLPVVWRIKTCPCCRSKVHHRPVPLFILQNTLSVFSSSGDANDTGDASDPWEGIFPTNLSFANFVDQDSDTDDDETEDDSFSSSDGQTVIVITDSDEDDSDEESDNTFFDLEIPPFAPARFRSRMTRDERPDVPAGIYQLIRRGVTYPMIMRYNMRYEPHEGIVARTDDGAEVYLGWNILLSDDDVHDGRGFMEWIGRNIIEEPRRWLHEEYDDHPVFRRLVYRWNRAELLTPDAEDETSSESDSGSDEGSDVEID